jgi:hypothetical protein
MRATVLHGTCFLEQQSEPINEPDAINSQSPRPLDNRRLSIDQFFEQVPDVFRYFGSLANQLIISRHIALDIEISDRKCMLLDEFPARLDLIAHERREDVICRHRILYSHPH